MCVRPLLLVAMVSWTAKVQALTPYTPDAHTLHLWHLDETAAPCVDSTVGGTNLTILANGATLGDTSFAGFGNCLNTVDGGQGNTTQKDALLSIVPLSGGSSDDVPLTLADPTSGAFTFEAIVRVDFNPALNLSARGSGMQIFSGEGDGDRSIFNGASIRLVLVRVTPARG